VEKCEAKRALFRKTVENIPPEQLFYIDECGVNQYLYREYGYAPKGEPVFGDIRGSAYERINIVAAKCCNRIIEPLTYNVTTNSALFEYWFEFRLLPAVPKGSVLVMDNATFHRKTKLRSLAESFGCHVLFLPPYSPDLNPIENYWAWLKQKLRSFLHLYDCLYDALVDCFKVN